MPNVAEVIRDHVTLAVECVDRLYLNAYVPGLQRGPGVVAFLRQRGQVIASPTLFGEITDTFKTALHGFCSARGIPWIEFTKGQDKDKLVGSYRQQFAADEGVVLVGVAQEKAKAWAATKKVDGRRVHFTFNWRTVYVNHYYIYLVDREWGPAFIKVCGYAPYALKVCLNAHEWAKRQAQRRRIPCEALDNGFLACADAAALQAICHSLSADDIQAFFDRWVDSLPLPLTADDAAAGFSYRLSILQMEVSLTQVFDNPMRGREFFEEVIRDNLDLGRPDRIQLLVDRKVLANTPSRFSTRVITDGILPSLHVEYKRCHIKQYCELGVALRTEVVISDTRDFGIGRRVCAMNWTALRAVGDSANQRLCDAEAQTAQPAPDVVTLTHVTRPSTTTDGLHTPALAFGDPRVMAVLASLVRFSHVLVGFTNRELVGLVASFLDQPYSSRQATYDLRRLRRKALIRRLPHSQRYQLTPFGRRTAVLFTKAHARVLAPGLALLDTLVPDDVAQRSPLASAWRQLDLTLNDFIDHQLRAA